jgi:transcription elongation factor GreB
MARSSCARSTRVRFLRKRLEGMVVVDRAPDDRSRIYFGAWVTLEDEHGASVSVRIVGPGRDHGERGLHQHGLTARARCD